MLERQGVIQILVQLANLMLQSENIINQILCFDKLNSPGDPAAGDEEHHRRELLVEPRHDAQAEALRAAVGPGGRTSGHQPEYGMSRMGWSWS